MPKAKKLPSGNYRVRVFSHTDANGKNVYMSFTAPTRQQAEQMGAKFAAQKTRLSKSDLTVKDAIDMYIQSKKAVLSPSTIRGYRSLQRNSFQEINNCRVRKLSNADLQAFVSGKTHLHDPKTVKNIYALLTASLRFVEPSFVFGNVSLPKKASPRITAPTDDTVMTLFRSANQRLKLAIALAAFGSLRRGEVCAIKYKDINGNRIYVHADIVRGDEGWVYKDYPKTSDSIREVLMPSEVVAMFGTGNPDDFVVGYIPSGLSGSYERLCRRLGVRVRFHDLRHYFASIGVVLHIPDTYLASFGGWKQGSMGIMKRVYQNQIAPISEQYAEQMTAHFSDIMRSG